MSSTCLHSTEWNVNCSDVGKILGVKMLLFKSKLFSSAKDSILELVDFPTASGQRTFYYRTIGLWNNLDPFLKSSCSVQVFKRILKNKLLDNFVNTL